MDTNMHCTRCHCPLPDAKFKRCAACRAYLTKQREGRRDRNALIGICHTCESRPRMYAYSKCETCHLAMGERARERRTQAALEGKCHQCFLRPALEGVKYCSVCKELSRQRYLRRSGAA